MNSHSLLLTSARAEDSWNESEKSKEETDMNNGEEGAYCMESGVAERDLPSRRRHGGGRYLSPDRAGASPWIQRGGVPWGGGGEGMREHPLLTTHLKNMVYVPVVLSSCLLTLAVNKSGAISLVDL